MIDIKLDSPAENALDRLQDTDLSPMEEVLFKAWTKANGIEKPDNVDDTTDYRGLWKHTGGKILPWGQLKQLTSRKNAESRLQKTLTDRMVGAVQQGEKEAVQTAKAEAPKPPKSE